jgi:hypothetical protein
MANTSHNAKTETPSTGGQLCTRERMSCKRRLTSGRITDYEDSARSKPTSGDVTTKEHTLQTAVTSQIPHKHIMNDSAEGRGFLVNQETQSLCQTFGVQPKRINNLDKTKAQLTAESPITTRVSPQTSSSLITNSGGTLLSSCFDAMYLSYSQ